jgi:hypothetical protein
MSIYHGNAMAKADSSTLVAMKWWLEKIRAS